MTDATGPGGRDPTPPPMPPMAPVSTSAACCAVADAASRKPCQLCGKATCSACRSYVNGRGVCAACFAQVQGELAYEKAGAASVPGAVIGGLIGSLVGAAAWALVAIATGVAIGYVAIAVGFAAGYGVFLGAGKRKGAQLQAIAVGCALLGLFLGNYLMVAHAVMKELPDAGLSYVDPRLFGLFTRHLSDVFQPLDILFMVLALLAAIRVTRPTQARLMSARPGR